MKITVEVPIMKAQGKSGKPGKTIRLELDTATDQIKVTTPVMMRDPVIGLAGLGR